MSSPDITSRLSISGQLLVRSGIEIERILGSMADDRATVSARLPSPQPFHSRLICADPVKRCLRIGYSHEETANAAVLAATSVILGCTHRGAQFAFSCARPRDTVHGSERAIELELPAQVLAVEYRRKPKRVQVPAQAQVYCRLRLGLLSFDAKIIDVGLDGSATLFAEDLMPLCAGTRVEDATVFHAERGPLTVDIDIHQVIPVVAAKGPRGTRLHCRILSAPETLEELIRLFIIDLK